MYNTILVPLDGSKFSERALPMAASLAEANRSHIILLRAASVSALPGTDSGPAQLQAIAEDQAYLAALAAGLSERGLSVEIAVPYGDAAEAILLEISLRNADLVIMCTHGRSGLGRWIYGSVAEKVLAQSPVPVLLVRPSGEIAMLGPEPAQASVLVPLDGSPFAEAALPHAATLAKAFGSTILLLHATEPPVGAYYYPEIGLVQGVLAEDKGEAESYLSAVAERLRSDGLSVETILREGWPADVIVYQGATLEPRLIVMATHGRTGVVRLIFGSVALEVVRRTSLPVLLIRPGEPATEAQK